MPLTLVPPEAAPPAAPSHGSFTLPALRASALHEALVVARAGHRLGAASAAQRAADLAHVKWCWEKLTAGMAALS